MSLIFTFLDFVFFDSLFAKLCVFSFFLINFLLLFSSFAFCFFSRIKACFWVNFSTILLEKSTTFTFTPLTKFLISLIKGFTFTKIFLKKVLLSFFTTNKALDFFALLTPIFFVPSTFVFLSFRFFFRFSLIYSLLFSNFWLFF